MLREVWRLQRDHFWVADMSGVDWPAMLRRYEPLLPRVATRAELSDLIWELQGELGTSHAYEYAGDHRKPPPVALGQLAAELQLVDGDESYRDHAHRARRRLGRAAPIHRCMRWAWKRSRASASSRSTASACRAARPPPSLLVHQAAAKVELTLARAEATRRRTSARCW